MYKKGPFKMKRSSFKFNSIGGRNSALAPGTTANKELREKFRSSGAYDRVRKWFGHGVEIGKSPKD